MSEPLLEVRDLSKRFGGVQALRSVGIKAYRGRVLGLIGENGAGKSTLVKSLTGNYQPDTGSISFAGVEVRFDRPQDASDVGIAAIQQEPSMFEDLTVAENIFVGSQPRGRRLIDWREMRKRARDLLVEIGVALDPDSPLRELSVAERHLVSLAKALSSDASLIIFDEPTASLSQAEIQHLYGIIEGLTAANKTIVFISHKFDEIFRICDDYAVLRDGEMVQDGVISDVCEDDLIRLMVGRTLKDIYPKSEAQIGETVLEVDGFSHPTEFADVSFSVRRGEILGFYGLVGSGRTETMEAVFGLKPVSSGTIRIDGRDWRIDSAQKAMEAGIAYVPEDRQRHGAILPFSIRKNMSLPVLGTIGRFTFLNQRAETDLCDEFGRRVHIKAAGWSQPVEELSGGNQQKVVIGKWLATQPKIVILDEPTKGVDVGSKSAVHQNIGELVAEGLSVIIVSSELEEVLGICDRIIVMHKGRKSAEFDRDNFSSESIVAAATGYAATSGPHQGEGG